MRRHYWKQWDLELLGSGRAFEESHYALPRQNIALDGGWGRGPVFAQPNLFLSHLHMDHALGLPRYVVNRQKMGDGRCRIFIPEVIFELAKEIVAAWQKAERRQDEIEWVPVQAGDSHHLDGHWQAEFFDVPHTVPAMGILLRRKVTRVRPEYQDRPSKEISLLIREGKEPVETIWQPAFAYCGDTGPELLDNHPELYEVGVLLLECTFVGAFHPEHAEKYGHIQWEDLLARADKFRNDAVVLTHFSKRYHPDQLWRHLNETTPENLRHRLMPMIVPSGVDDRRD